MSSSSPYQNFLKCISVSQFQKFIPRKWKQPINQLKESPIMIDSLVTSLKECASQGNLYKAVRIFALIQVHASSSSSSHIIVQPISSLILSCTSLKVLPEGKQLHAHIFSLGFEQNFNLVPKLVSFYSSLNLLFDAHNVTEDSNILHPLPWNLLISSYVRNGLSEKAISTYRQMVKRGSRPDNFTYPSVLKACGEELNLSIGKEIHQSIENTGLDWCLFVHNALVSMYARCGELGIARNLFDKMPERDTVSWNSMISGYASKGMWDEAFKLFEIMKMENFDVNIIIWNTIAGGCLRTGNFFGTLQLLSQMRNHGVNLDHVAIIIALGACSHIGLIKLGKEVHGYAFRSSCDGFDNVQNALITMYSRCNGLTHAYNLFQIVQDKSIITWNSMLSGYCHLERSEEASSLFREMLFFGIEPNYVTIASILPLCARVANLQHGKEFHCYIIRHEGFKDYLLIWNALVDMYARSGKVIEATRLFDSMNKRDEVTYTSLISGYGSQGKGKIALEIFEEMIMFHIKPDHVTMVAVLSACSHSGLVTEGQIIFEKIQKIYGVTPRLEHYACMVDLYGRAGLLNKAREMITKMPFKPSPAMWATLLGACRIHGNTEIGEWTAEKLLEMKPLKPGYLVSIANMYAAAGAWTKLAKVRTFMRDSGVQKDPGCAWVDVGTGFSRFLVDDTSNPHAHECYPMLEALTALMKDKDVGYVSTNHEFASDDKALEECDEQRSLCMHL